MYVSGFNHFVVRVFFASGAGPQAYVCGVRVQRGRCEYSSSPEEFMSGSRLQRAFSAAVCSWAVARR
eukprot:11169481-Lingulodinium_polyedra.AAC.1